MKNYQLIMFGCFRTRYKSKQFALSFQLLATHPYYSATLLHPFLKLHAIVSPSPTLYYTAKIIRFG